jgi:GNAT superfamily N-acetyltransferase
MITLEPPPIFPVAEEHLPELVPLAGVIWRAHYPGIISREQIDFMLARMYSLETLRAEIVSQGIHFYQLRVDERMVGFASIGPTETPGVMKLHKLYLLPELHGCGFGRRLLQHGEAEAGRLSARRLILAVNKRNAKAIAAYQRNGFTIAESVVADIGGGFVMDDFIMAKDVSVGRASSPFLWQNSQTKEALC